MPKLDYEALAKEFVAEKRGIGMIPPFYAETASANGGEDWPLWIVRNKSCNSLGLLMARAAAESLASAMNEAAENNDRLSRTT
jgi:hypothetical protein